MRFRFFIYSFLLLCACAEDDKKQTVNSLQISSIEIDGKVLNPTDFSQNIDISIDKPILLKFSTPIDVRTSSSISLITTEGSISYDLSYLDDNKTLSLEPEQNLPSNKTITITISDELKGVNGEIFSGINIEFTTIQESFAVSSVIIDGQTANLANRIKDVNRNPTIEITFPIAINITTVNNATVKLIGADVVPILSFAFSNGDKKLTITTTQTLDHLQKYTLSLSTDVKGALGEMFIGYSKIFYTEVDPTPKKPVISDEELLTLVQQQTFKYFYDFAHPASGMARERNTSGNIVTVGGSGFGLMSIIVGIERGFITRQQGTDHLAKVLTFLESANRFHGVWPHWLDGNTGQIVHFTPDDGGDIVETSFMVHGLLTFRQYLNSNDTEEAVLIDRINTLWSSVEWDWYTHNENVLYWNWSPIRGWELKVQGHNETLITYFLAAASPTHSIPTLAYTSGYSRNGAMVNGNTFYGITLPLGESYGGPLFFSHYSFLGLNPTNLSDQFANYWTQNTNHSLINQAYCIDNPKNFVGYSDECWGLTASDNQNGYLAHSPTNDLGVITPTAALSSFPYTPTESMKALKFFYYTLGDRVWGTYGFYDAFNPTENWYASSYLAIDQGPIIVMIENHRTGLLWDLLMSAPEAQSAMTKLGFTN